MFQLPVHCPVEMKEFSLGVVAEVLFLLHWLGLLQHLKYKSINHPYKKYFISRTNVTTRSKCTCNWNCSSKSCICFRWRKSYPYSWSNNHKSLSFLMRLKKLHYKSFLMIFEPLKQGKSHMVLHGQLHGERFLRNYTNKKQTLPLKDSSAISIYYQLLGAQCLGIGLIQFDIKWILKRFYFIGLLILSLVSNT